MKVNEKLREYIENNIIPEYHNFDDGHNENHARAVIERSLEYFDELEDRNIDINMVYAVAAYHDVGIKIKREGHPKYSKEIVLQDKILENWFNKKQILTIAEACEDHSTSTGHIPRSIYGKIVSDADKDTDIDIGLMRGWNFSLKFFPDLSFEERIDEVHSEIVKRFGDETIGGKGLVKFYISGKRNITFMKEMIKYAFDKNAYREKMLVLLEQEKD